MPVDQAMLLMVIVGVSILVSIAIPFGVRDDWIGLIAKLVVFGAATCAGVHVLLATVLAFVRYFKRGDD